MEYRNVKTTDLIHLNQFWNNNKDHIYKDMDKNEVQSKFLTCTKEYNVISLIAIENNQIIGFSSGTFSHNSETAFITCVLVEKSQRRQKIGTKLLTLLEDEFMKHNPLRSIDISFFNPVHLEWLIPNTLQCDHPNSPGVELKSPSYAFMHANLYQDFAIQNAYYLDLKLYQDHIEDDNNKEILRSKGIEITFYNPQMHSGFEALFMDLKSEHWKREIMHHIYHENSKDDILIVHQGGVIYGFAGPLSVQKSGRGNFSGIGVHSALRGQGTGTLLFSFLCKEFKKMGAQYMSIFTGVNNNARHIYEAQGFKVVQTWVNMRKEIKKGD